MIQKVKAIKDDKPLGEEDYLRIMKQQGLI